MNDPDAAGATVFDDRLAEFARWQDSPWGRLRYTVAAANLARHLHSEPQSILDLGGGNGREAVMLAEHGHHVTIADISEPSLTQARRHAADRGVADRITTRVCDICTVAEEFGPSTMDAVLVHNVLQYLPDTIDTATTLTGLTTLVRPGGLISLLAPNADADPILTALRTLDLDEALRQLNSPTRYSGAYQTRTRACRAADMTTILGRAGIPEIHHYGIRAVCDAITDDDLKTDPDFYHKLERLELAMTDRSPYRDTARFFQLIAEKPAEPT